MVEMTLTDLLSCSDITDVECVVQNVKSLVFEIRNIGTLFMILLMVVITKMMMMMTTVMMTHCSALPGSKEN